MRRRLTPQRTRAGVAGGQGIVRSAEGRRWAGPMPGWQVWQRGDMRPERAGTLSARHEGLERDSACSGDTGEQATRRQGLRLSACREGDVLQTPCYASRRCIVSLLPWAHGHQHRL
jgi:hypothetical protein